MEQDYQYSEERVVAGERNKYGVGKEKRGNEKEEESE